MLAVVLSLLLPGLGHAYMGKLSRALIWVVGLAVIAVVIQRGATDPSLWVQVIPGTALSVFAALDIAALMRSEGTDRDPA